MAREIEFCVGDFDASELLVTEVLYDGGLSQCFRVTVYFHSQAEDFEATECLGEAVQLSLLPAQHSAFYIQGFIESCQPIGQVDGQGFQNYVCQIVPALSLLKQQPVCFLYRDQKLLDLIQFLLSGKCDKLSKLRLACASPAPLMVYDYNGTPTLDSGQAVCFVLPPGKLSQDYPRYQQLLQVHQSNFDFFHQLLSLNGFSYYFDHTQAHMPLVISDCLHNSKVRQPLDLYFQAHQQVDQMGTCLYQHTIQSRASPDKTLVRGYHPEQSQGNIIAECLSALPNTNPFKSPNSYQAPIIATDPIMAERLSQYYQGHFDYTSQLASQSGQGLVYPGLLYTIEKAPLPAINATTLLMESCHWQLRVDGNTINQLNDCQWQGQSAAAELSRYSLPLKFSAPSQIKNWTVRCVFSGERNLPDQDYNTLDPQGYYCLEVPKHFSSLGGYTPCLLDIRLLQPHQSGDNQQVSPLPQGTRVSVRFSDDDSQHPYISSIGHSRTHASLTNTSNAQDMVWQDEKQNRFSLISSGPFAPNRRSWHQSAIELYAPNYDGYVNKAGLRIGEAVPSSQLANALPGLLWATSSQWREIHPDSYVEVLGWCKPLMPNSRPSPRCIGTLVKYRQQQTILITVLKAVSLITTSNVFY